MTQQQEEITCSPSIKASLCKWRGRREGRHAITSRTDVGWRWDHGMMSPSAPHQALSSHIKQPIKSPGLWGMQGAMSVATLLWTLHCVDSGNWCFKVSSWLNSSFILLGQGTCERATGEGKTNRKQLLPLFFFFPRVKAYQGQISVSLVIWVKLKIVWGNGKQGVFTF